MNLVTWSPQDDWTCGNVEPTDEFTPCFAEVLVLHADNNPDMHEVIGGVWMHADRWHGALRLPRHRIRIFHAYTLDEVKHLVAVDAINWAWTRTQ
jgi:hypothetical protein